MTIREAFQLALDHHRAGRLPQAEALYRGILAQHPDDVNVIHGLALLAHATGRSEDSLRLMGRAIAVAPRFAQLHFSLAGILHGLGRDEEAVAALQATVRLEPNNAAAYLNLSLLLYNLGRRRQSVDAARRAVELDPRNADAHTQLACAYLAIDRAADAARAANAALDVNPILPTALNNLALARERQGRVSEAIDHYRQALQLQPDYLAATDNLLFALHYIASDAQTLSLDHTRWGESIASRVGTPPKRRNEHTLDRPLRIGYVSGDFRKHPIEYFIEPILANHDRSEFELAAYSNSSIVDASTERLLKHFNLRRQIDALSDDQAANLIAADRIDILVDLSVHTAGNRLLVFARKPAPLQMTYLGYPGTTGLAAVDYRITATAMDLANVNEGPEQLLVLPHSYFCYQPPRRSPHVAQPPSLGNGYITFGSANRLSKIGGQVIELWSRILGATPDSKLQIMAAGLGEPATRRGVIEQFAAHGIPLTRLILEPSRDEAGYLAAHHRVDIMLDPFPFNGGTTTLHALWMGVPTVTLAGQLPVGRMGLNILTTIGLVELVAESTDRYVEKAVELAKDQSRLADLRRGMRQRLLQSPLMNATSFVRDLERLYRGAWVRWCG